MAKDRTRKIPEKIPPNQRELENDGAREADWRQTAPEHSAGFERDHDPSHVIWFLD